MGLSSVFSTAITGLTAAETTIDVVGNNLARDIKGANALGMISVWLDWAPRRAKIPADESEMPQYTIKQPLELLQVIDQLEQILEIRD